MRDIPESEARALFSERLFCDDIDAWVPFKAHGDTVEVIAGVVDADGKSVGLLVKMLYRYSPKTKIRTCQFTVFVRRPYGLERAYQLELNQYPVKLADVHKWSHEHVGSLRLLGDASWGKWEYDDAVAHFCAQTNISFRPPLPHPEHFYLK
jgi:hypothetical protein